MTVRLSKEQIIKVLNADDLFDIMQQVLFRESKIRVPIEDIKSIIRLEPQDVKHLLPKKKK